MPLIITLVRVNIEDIPHIIYPFNYGEYFFNPILPQNNFIWIELSGPPSLQNMNTLCL